MTYFSNINYGGSYPLIKFDIKNQLECGETKKINLVERYGSTEIIKRSRPNQTIV